MTIETHPITSRDQWLALRKKDVTASDIAAILGLDKYRTPARVYAEKTGEISGNADNAMTRRGRWLEPAVLEALREAHPDWDIRKATVYLRDPAIRLGCTPDFVAIRSDKTIVNIQAKVVSKPVYEREWGDDEKREPPMGYMLQTAAENMLMEVPQGIVAALVIDTFSAELQEFGVPRHADAEARIRQAATDFWDAVRDGRPPRLMYDMDAELIEARYPSGSDANPIDLSGDNRMPELLETREALKESIKSAAERCEAIDAEIKDKLGRHAEAKLPGWKITWKDQYRSEYVVEAKTFRQLRITRKKESSK